MKVRLDESACTGHGRCYDLAPDIFDEDEFGRCVVLQTNVPPIHEDAARAAIANCPESALHLEEENEGDVA